MNDSEFCGSQEALDAIKDILVHKFEKDDSDRPSEPYQWDQIRDFFCSKDPSETKKYASWIVESYICGGIRRWNELNKIPEALSHYMIIKDAGLLKTDAKGYGDLTIDETNINNFCGLYGCPRNALNRHERQIGLYQLLNKYYTQLNKQLRNLALKSGKADKIIHYNDGDTVVIQPLTSEAARKHGRDANWPILTMNQTLFKQYADVSPYFFVLSNIRVNQPSQRLQQQHNEMSIDQSLSTDATELESPKIVGAVGAVGAGGVRGKQVIDPTNYKYLYQLHSGTNQYIDQESNPFRLSLFAQKFPQLFDTQVLVPPDHAKLMWFKFDNSILGKHYDGLLFRNIYSDQEMLFNLHDSIKNHDTASFLWMIIKRNGKDTERYFEHTDEKANELVILKYSEKSISKLNNILQLAPKNIKLLLTEDLDGDIAFLDLTNVKYLVFGPNYSKSIVGVNLNNITHLTISSPNYDFMIGLDLKRVYYLVLEYGFHKSLSGLNLKNVTHLVMGYDNLILDEAKLSGKLQINNFINLKSVTHLTIGCFSDEYILDGLDLKSVKELRFEKYFNRPINSLDLKTVETLSFGNNFNQSLDALDLSNIKRLFFGNNFNQAIDSLNLRSLKYLQFGDNFNQPLDGLNLKNLSVLIFGRDFNQPFDHINLPNLNKLSLGYSFDHSIDNLNSQSLTDFSFCNRFKNPIKNQSLLKNVTRLAIGKHFNEVLSTMDTSKVIDLICNYNGEPIENLDAFKNATSLTFGRKFNQSIDGFHLGNVKQLIFGSHFNTPILNPDLLKNVTHLTFGKQFNQSVDHLDLTKVQYLQFGDQFNMPFNANIKNAIKLTFGKQFNRNIDNADIRNLRLVTFGFFYSRPIHTLITKFKQLKIDRQITTISDL